MIAITPEYISKIIAGGESQTVEFKSSIPSNTNIMQVLSAFANTDGGILLIGVKDRDEIMGVPNDEIEKIKSRIRNIAFSLLYYPIDIGNVVIDEKNIIYTIVDKSPPQYGPVMSSTGTFYGMDYPDIIEIPPTKFIEPKLREKVERVKPGRKVIAFVAMSFREEEPSLVDYYHAMERAVKRTGLPIELMRMDLVEGDFEISRKIMDEIDKSNLIISDFTLNSRNVYFELGYARGKNRQIIQTARKGTNLEFDIRNWRTLLYRNATELEEKLIPALKTAYVEIVDDVR